MIRGNFKNSKPSFQFLVSLLIVLSGWLVFQLIAIVTGALIFDVGFQDIQSVLNNPVGEVSINYQKYLQSVISLGMFILSPLVIAFLLSEQPAGFLKLNNIPGLSISLLVALMMILTLPMNNFLTFLNNQLDLSEILPGVQSYMVNMETEAEKIFERFLNVPGISALLINILIIGIIPALGEELLFRGVLQRIFINWTRNIHLGVIITSLVFAFLHFQFLSLLPRFVLGMVLGYLFVWTNSLWMPVLAHFVNNTFAVIYYYFMYQGKIGDGIENVGKPDYNPFYALLSTLIVIIILFVIRRIMKEKSNPPQAQTI